MHPGVGRGRQMEGLTPGRGNQQFLYMYIYIYTLNYNCLIFFDRLGLPAFSGHYGLGVIHGYLK